MNGTSVQEMNGSFDTTIIGQRKENSSLNTTIAGLLEKNRSLDATITGLQEQNRSLNTIITGLRNDYRVLDTAIMELQKQKGSLKAGIPEFREEEKLLGLRATKLSAEKEIVKRKNEERKYAATKKQDIESDEVVSAQFGNLFRRCRRWTWKYFKLSAADFRIEDFPLFARELELVSWVDTNWKDKKYIQVRHLVEAVLGNILVGMVFKCPFAGCARDFRHEFLDLFETKLRGTILSPLPVMDRWFRCLLTDHSGR